MTVKRSVVLGLRLLSSGANSDQRRTCRQGRHLGRMDRAAHRHPAAPHRRGGRIHLASGDQGGAGRARQCRDRRPGHRPDRAGDLDAGPHLSGHRGPGAGRARHQSRRRLRPAGGVLGLRLRARHRRQFPALRLRQARAGDRRRDLLAHPRLERPRHLRAVRRRRRRRGAGGAGRLGHQRRSWRADHASALRRPPQVQALCRWRPVLDPDRRPSADGRPGSVQARRLA